MRGGQEKSGPLPSGPPSGLSCELWVGSLDSKRGFRPMPEFLRSTFVPLGSGPRRLSPVLPRATRVQGGPGRGGLVVPEPGRLPIRIGHCPDAVPMSDPGCIDHSWFAYVHVDDAAALYKEYQGRNVTFSGTRSGTSPGACESSPSLRPTATGSPSVRSLASAVEQQNEVDHARRGAPRIRESNWSMSTGLAKWWSKPDSRCAGGRFLGRNRKRRSAGGRLAPRWPEDAGRPRSRPCRGGRGRGRRPREGSFGRVRAQLGLHGRPRPEILLA